MPSTTKKTAPRPPKRTPRKLNDLVPDPRNARLHPERNLEMIQASLQAVGAARSIVIDEQNVVRAGNGTIEAAKRLGMKKLQVVDADGETIVAVRRRNLTEEQKIALALYDNRTSELATWNPALLQQLAGEMGGIDMSRFWSKDELRALYAQIAGTPGLTDPDAVPAPRKTSIVAGDLFELGQWPIDLPPHACAACGAVNVSAGTLDVETTVWDVELTDDTGETTHSTQKPVECMARPMRNHLVDEVYEPFSGSGSTLMAGELLGRVVYAMELMPVYVQQTIDRWEAFTGKKARKVDGPHTARRPHARPNRRPRKT